MNTKQFLSSIIFAGVDWGVGRIPFFGAALAIPFRIVFPTMLYERVDTSKMRTSVFVSIYLLGFSICFALQAFLAHHAGTMGTFTGDFATAAGGNDGRITFLKDGNNLLNYLLLVPLYLVAGSGYLLSVFSLNERMGAIGPDVGFTLDASRKPYLSGVMLIGLFILILIFSQSQYAMDMHKSDRLFWFHGDSVESAFGFNGYAYLLINAFLAGFVIIVALAHLELFRWSTTLSKAVRGYDPDKDSEKIFLHDGHKLKTLFSPFTETAIWSKAFAMLLAMNLYTWKASGVSGGQQAGVDDGSLFIRLIFVVYLVIVLWVVSLPRYRVQYELFKLRSRSGVHEYFDIRMPWTIGWSVFIDILLLSFFSTAILGKGEFFGLLSTFLPN